MKILILSLSWLPTQPRVLRQVSSLTPNHEVSVAGYGDATAQVVETVSLTGLSPRTSPQLTRFPFPLRVFRAALAFSGLYSLLYWVFHPAIRHARRKLQENKFDLIIANELETVPLAVDIARGAPVIADLHEYTPGHLDPRSAAYFAYQRYRLWLTRNYLEKPSALITVGRGISELYEKHWGVDPLHIVRNTPPYEDLSPSRIDPDKIELVYHGLGGAGRGLDALLEALKDLPSTFEAHFYIAGGGDRALRKTVSKLSLEHRVFFHPPVPTVEIAQTINKHDIAVVFHQPHTENFSDSLPNKFFESIQGRLAMVVSPSPEMVRIVEDHQIGVVTKNFSSEALRESLLDLNGEKISFFKSQTNLAAMNYCWEHEEKVLLGVVESLCPSERPAS